MYDDHIEECVKRRSEEIRLHYSELIREYLDPMKSDDNFWDHVGSIYYDYSVIDYDLVEKLGIHRDQYLIYGISRGNYYSKFIDRWEFQDRLNKLEIPHT